MANKELNFNFTAAQLINEDRVTQKDLDTIKNWMNNDTLPKISEEQIILFLLSCENNCEDTRTTIKTFYQLKREFPYLFDDRNLQRDALQKQIGLGRFFVLPERTNDGCLIIFYSIHNTSYQDFELTPIFILLLMTFDAALLDYPPKKLIVLLDIEGMGLMHLTRIRLGLLKTILRFFQEALPLKMKSMHLLNSGSLIDKVLTIVKPFLSKEIIDVIHFHTSSVNMEEFYEKWIPKKCLPKDYGGDLPSVEELHQKNIEKLTKLQPYFEAEELQRRSVC